MTLFNSISQEPFKPLCKTPADTELGSVPPTAPPTDPAVPSVWSRLTETRPDRGRTQAVSPPALHSLTPSSSLKYEIQQQVLLNTPRSLSDRWSSGGQLMPPGRQQLQAETE